ncbi:chemotaxis protein CheD [Desulfovibrio ferrophilus]|uniref:Probable chemoreceptor glutamine deamidase CheD n=1 Tax=Desulfovibrio ferrophilus TaxID=241368 RepID=A0A2Z6B2E2_9BACT|nr:chemotaxis protein CheD [Desulfovibrio ferrophilus]BBD09600.1 probable chemoreceptor glutamine deamidase CheD [Desulfovibrio ferrophilus]
MHKVIDEYPGIQHISLGVGEGVIAGKPTAVSTVLGSCVAVTFHDPVRRLGAVFHALLPNWGDYPNSKNPGEFKYVDAAIQHFANAMYLQGSSRANVVCKVFGGANAMFKEQFGVGQRNVLTAFKTLEGERLRVVASDVGGNRGRKLIFITHTGEVFMKRLRTQQLSS